LTRLDAETLVCIAPDVLFQELGDESVVLDLKSGIYFGLNEVGSRIWQWILPHGRLGTIRDKLIEEYDVPADRAWNDLEALVAELIRRGLVTAVPAPAA
jgi:hypothetical protein